MVGKVGANDPAVASLQMQLGLDASAIALAHGYKGEKYEEALEHHLRLAQSPDDLKARISTAGNFLNDYAGSTGHGASAPGNGSGYSMTATNGNGHTIGSKDGGKTWYDVKTGKPVQ